MRHFHVRVKHPIPSFLRFGKIQIHPQHVADAIVLIKRPVHNGVVRVNCDNTGHLANNSPRPVFCNLCKSVDHKDKNCPHSWAWETVQADQQEEPEIATPSVGDQMEIQVENEVELRCDEVLPKSHESSQS